MIDFILFVFGVLGLWIGTELAVREASKIAKKLNWSELFIGLTILAFGTDLPELAVAIKGSLNNIKGIDSSDIIVGNAIGSTICQISVVIGITSLFHYIRVGKVQIRYIGIEIFGSIFILTLVGYDGMITWNDGAIMIIAFLIYIFTNYQREKVRIRLENKASSSITKWTFYKHYLLNRWFNYCNLQLRIDFGKMRFILLKNGE